MRLDKMLSECGVASRSEVARACRKGLVLVNGAPAARPDLQVDETTAAVVYCGALVRYRKFVYLLLNKPSGYISATEDGSDPVVTDLLPPEYRRMGVFPCGRLDKYTVGLMLLTNDGDLSHRLLAPKNHVAKSYRFTCEKPLSNDEKTALEAGVDIGGYFTKPCQIELTAPCEGTITITEGKYHQIKRMLEAVDNKITFLERVTFGGIALPPDLKRGEWRELNDEELNLLKNS
ncbi:MAG: rRNA pseudouridine synthase [Ruminococcaceae bacterium]|nr:rRNA pseudouridine synthase [Oscillospiraceae bacterium]